MNKAESATPAHVTGAGRSRRNPSKAIDALLHRVFGVMQLREGQRAVIDSVMAGKDTLAVMPTGGGKSLCYQIPASLLSGTTIVVSPLISLMKDQLERLTALGIAAVQLNSSLSAEEEGDATARLRTGKVRIAFCTPERLCSAAFLDVLRPIALSLIVIDEAHCISQWGHDFRPAYLQLDAAIRALRQPPVLALTATATEEVIADIRKQLGTPHMRVINTGLYRPNLRYRVLQATNAEERHAHALRLVRETSGVGIVYAATVKAVKELHAQLLQVGESVTCYHGKLSARERQENQDMFMRGERRVMVATNAFGMGIDKVDTRFVIHLQMPANLEAYYQESGRAGRDGLPADCTLLFFQDDKRIQQFFLARHYPDAEELRAIYQAARNLSASASPFPFAALHERLDSMPENRLKLSLTLLKEGRLLKQDRKLAYSLRGEPKAESFTRLAQVYAEKQERDRAALERMVAYAQSGYCRWKLLLDYFGDDDSKFERCGSCDNCVSPPAVMAEEPTYEQAPASERHTEAAVPHIVVGSKVRVPKFDIGTVSAVEGDKITVDFPQQDTRTFMAEFIELVDDPTAQDAASVG
jgi:ATP-dependent DNA helicase RecQ